MSADSTLIMTKYLIQNVIICYLVSLLLIYILNNVFLYHKTSYLLITSIFVFVGISFLFFYLELEFLAITFSMVYVGGIVVMFLFLIMTVDVNIQNVEGTKILELNKSACLFISFLSLMIVLLLFFNLDVFLFNTIDFSYIVEDSIEENE